MVNVMLRKVPMLNVRKTIARVAVVEVGDVISFA
jgi:hypothetical protein